MSTEPSSSLSELLTRLTSRSPYFVELNRAVLSEQGWGYNLTDQELVDLVYGWAQVGAYALYLVSFCLWYTRSELLVPRFLQTQVRMVGFLLTTCLFLHDAVWVGFYRQASLGRTFIDAVGQ